MDAAVFAPIGGGRLNKVEAFDILSERLGIHERPLSTVRLDLFRLVFLLGTEFQEQRGNPRKNQLELWDEGWSLIGDLYESLAEIETQAMKPTHEATLRRFLDERSAEQHRLDALGQ